jgi:hypothetical protein
MQDRMRLLEDPMEKTTRRNLLIVAAGGVTAAVGLVMKPETQAQTQGAPPLTQNKAMAIPSGLFLAHWPRLQSALGNSRLIQP